MFKKPSLEETIIQLKKLDQIRDYQQLAERLEKLPEKLPLEHQPIVWFWRGKLAALEGDYPEAMRDLAIAAELVLQAATLATGGDVFLLDMGEPVRIKDLAEQMLRLSGLSLRDSQNPNGDIEIVCTGLRSGEKLYEELLIEANSQPTKHPLIFRATERAMHPQDLWSQLDQHDESVNNQNHEKALEILSKLIPEWQKS